MSRVMAVLILIAGIALLSTGLRSSESAVSQLSEIFHDRPTRETSVLITAGLAGIGLGAWWLFKSKRNAS